MSPLIINLCPLTSKLNFPQSTPYIRRCIEIIEQARHIWGYYSPEEQSVYYEVIDGIEVPKKFPPYPVLKKLPARSIQNWYVEHSDLILTNPKTPEAIKKAVQDVRRYARPSIESSITDKEILAIFAICEAFDAIRNIQREKPEEAIKEKVLTASTFLKLAKTGFEPEKQAVTQESKNITFPLPSGAKISDIKIVFLDEQTVKVIIKEQSRVFNFAETGFSHKQNGKPTTLWDAMLAYVNGDVFRHKQGERINDILQKFFVTDKDLIRANQPLFNICKKTKQIQKPHNIPSKICPICNKQHRHYCRICDDEQEHCEECHDGLYEEAHKELSK
ncbi:MAG: hypothetical protein HUU08_17245 [Candidatus Brocadia sp.]|nr:hypothetical protein [Candidatus Brocadia sp.]